jgi:hypothetical protein
MKKNTFVGYSLDDVKYNEANYFTIVIDNDFFTYKGRSTFTHKTAKRYYARLVNALRDMIKTGTERDKRYGINKLSGIRLQPLRLH